jgi:RNA polymerase sigma-70 factor (family 1)
VNKQTKADTMHIQMQLAENNQAALKQLYNDFGERLLHFAFAIIHNREQAEEIVADVFIQVWQKRVRIATIENLTWYLYITTKNISLNYLRKEQKQKTILIDTVTLPYYTIEPTAVDHLVTTELLQSITKAINDLPPKCRLIFKLIKEDGLQYKEVASLLNLSIKTVENQMGIALKKIHASIQVHVPVYSIKESL